MKGKKNLLMYAVVLSIGAMLLASGCATSGVKLSAKSTSSMDDIRKRVIKEQKQIDNLVSNLNRLTSVEGKKLQKQYKKFVEDVASLESRAKDRQARAMQMRANTEAYFDAWEKELQNLESAEMRSRSSQRRSEAISDFEKIIAAVQKVKDAFEPFMGDLHDIQKYLEYDLTSGGVRSISDLISEANSNAVTLNSMLAEVVSELDRVAASK